MPARVLVADPPWKFRDRLPGKKRGAEKVYSCLSVEELKRFPLPAMREDAFLFLWYVTSMVKESWEVCCAWGFEPTGGELVWVKTTEEKPLILDPQQERIEIPRNVTRLAFGMGRTVRNCDERCLIARRGRPQVRSRSVRSVFFAPRGEHSAKPDRFYEIVEELSFGPYVELFARRRREGWDCRGNELDKKCVS